MKYLPSASPGYSFSSAFINCSIAFEHRGNENIPKVDQHHFSRMTVLSGRCYQEKDAHITYSTPTRPHRYQTDGHSQPLPIQHREGRKRRHPPTHECFTRQEQVRIQRSQSAHPVQLLTLLLNTSSLYCLKTEFCSAMMLFYTLHVYSVSSLLFPLSPPFYFPHLTHRLLPNFNIRIHHRILKHVFLQTRQSHRTMSLPEVSSLLVLLHGKI